MQLNFLYLGMAFLGMLGVSVSPFIPQQQPLMSTPRLIGLKAEACSELSLGGAFLLCLQTQDLSAPDASKNNWQSSQLVGSNGVSMRVLWTISEYKVSEGAIWGQEEARKLLFKPLDIDATQITFDGRTCRGVIFQREKVSAKEYLEHAYRTTPQALGIEEESVEVVKTNCDLPGFAEYMRLRDRRLIVYLNGVFFYFKPAVRY